MRDLIGLQALLLLQPGLSECEEVTEDAHEVSDVVRSLCAANHDRDQNASNAHNGAQRKFLLAILRTLFRNFARSPARAV